MGRVYTTTGIQFNLGGTATPIDVLELSNGTAAIGVNNGTELFIECLSNNIHIETDTGRMRLFAGEGTIQMTIGGTAQIGRLRIINGATNGTIAELLPTGDLRIAGTIGTGIAF